MSGRSSSDSEVEDPVLNSYLRRLQAARASFGIVGSVVAPGWRSPAAEAFETWCIERAWQQCEKCHRRDPCILSESFLSPALSVHAMPKHAVCRHCAAGTGFKSPMWSDVPVLLRRLETCIARALAPAYVQYKREKRLCGYRIHMNATRIRWKDNTFDDRVLLLPEALQEKARMCHTWLWENATSDYRSWVEQHGAVLAHCENLWMAVDCLTQVGIEVALWPHLFFNRDWCPSRARVVLGLKRRRGVDPESSDDESDEDLSGTRASGKELFMSLVFSEVTDYGSSYDLLHFFYDQWMFKTLGGAAAVCERNLRSTLSGKQFAPQYWTWQHQKLLDLVRQLGFPTLFVTLAP